MVFSQDFNDSYRDIKMQLRKALVLVTDPSVLLLFWVENTVFTF